MATMAALKRVQDAMCRSHGSFVLPAIEARAIPGMGVGVVARESIPKDTLVLQAARDVWFPFSAEHAIERARDKAPRFLQQLEELVASNPSFQFGEAFVPNALALGVHLLVNFPHAQEPDRVFADMSKPANSSRDLEALYVNSLPRFVDLPLYWDDAQFKELQGCTEVARSIQQTYVVNSLRNWCGLHSIHNDVRCRSKFYMQVYRHFFGTNNSFINPEAFFWAISILMSRATSGQHQPFTLIPFFDLFNHADNG